mmetsp:Transcript_7645/g.23949  ORF Transcript_7645/g.23949 Transcript_7645/m.23949 type:complete len:281 (-) Transcript_7645:540-1382(-)
MAPAELILTASLAASFFCCAIAWCNFADSCVSLSNATLYSSICCMAPVYEVYKLYASCFKRSSCACVSANCDSLFAITPWSSTDRNLAASFVSANCVIFSFNWLFMLAFFSLAPAASAVIAFNFFDNSSTFASNNAFASETFAFSLVSTCVSFLAVAASFFDLSASLCHCSVLARWLSSCVFKLEIFCDASLFSLNNSVIAFSSLLIVAFAALNAESFSAKFILADSNAFANSSIFCKCFVSVNLFSAAVLLASSFNLSITVFATPSCLDNSEMFDFKLS